MINLFVVFGAVVILNNLFAHDGFDDIRRPVGILGALFAEQFADCLPNQKYADRERNDCRIDDRREKRAQTEHKYCNDHNLHDIQNKVHEVVREEIGEFRDVVRHAHDDFAGGAVVEIVERKSLQFVEDILADVSDDAVPHPPEAALLVKGNDNFRQPREQKAAQSEKIQAIIFVRDDRINDKPKQQRRDHRRRHGNQHDDEHKNQELFMRQSIAHEPL